MRNPIKAGILRFMNGPGRRVIPPLMRWLADGAPEFTLPGGDGRLGVVPPPYTSPEGSPITVWLVNETMRRQMADPDIQRDLNAALQVLRLESLSKPMLMMYASMMARGIPVEECFAQLLSNALVLGFGAGRLYSEIPEKDRQPGPPAPYAGDVPPTWPAPGVDC